METETEDRAPDFSQGYPSKGERIGPAWRWAWTVLVDHEWRQRSEFFAIMANATGLAPRTCENLILKAGRCGFLETEYRGRDRRAWIRRP